MLLPWVTTRASTDVSCNRGHNGIASGTYFTVSTNWLATKRNVAGRWSLVTLLSFSPCTESWELIWQRGFLYCLWKRYLFYCCFKKCVPYYLWNKYDYYCLLMKCVLFCLCKKYDYYCLWPRYDLVSEIRLSSISFPVFGRYLYFTVIGKDMIITVFERNMSFTVRVYIFHCHLKHIIWNVIYYLFICSLLPLEGMTWQIIQFVRACTKWMEHL